MASNKSSKKMRAGDIVACKQLKLYPNLNEFLNNILNDGDIATKRVGKQFSYPATFRDQQYYKHHGLVMDYFIRKVLAEKYKFQLKDELAEKLLKDIDLYFTPQVERQISPTILSRQYEVYKNPKTKAIDILYAIKQLAVCKFLFKKEQIPCKEINVKWDMLFEVKNYFYNLSHYDVEAKCNIDCEYFDGSADMVFDSKFMYEIKTSKNTFIPIDDRARMNFFKLLLYGFGYYKKTGIIIKEFKIYNPLLGEELTLKVDDIDMIHFGEVLDKYFIA